MPQVLKFTCDLPNGVHARPASHIETLCNQFTARIEWFNLRTGRQGDAKSALSLIGTDTLQGDECHISIEGVDAEQAFYVFLPLSKMNFLIVMPLCHRVRKAKKKHCRSH